MVSAKSHHRKRDQSSDEDVAQEFWEEITDTDNDNSNSNDNDNDNDDNDDDDDDDLKAFECALRLSWCFQDLETTYGDASNITEVAGNVRVESIRTFCTDLTKAGQCALDVALDKQCDVMPDYVTAIIRKGVEVLNFVCVDKLDELEEHWECLLNTEVTEEVDECQETHSDLQECNAKPFIACTEKTFNESPYCHPGAIQLVSDVVNKLIEIIPHCSEQTKMKRFLRRILRK